MGAETGVEERHVLGRPVTYSIGLWGIRYFPRSIAYMLAERVADISYLVYKKARRNVMMNLRMVLPEAPSGRISSLALSTFRNYSRYLIDYGRFKVLDRESLSTEMVYVEGTKNIETALERGNGLILLTAHLGNWEFGGIFFGRQDIKINVLTVHDEMEQTDVIRERYRKNHNINTITLGDSPFAGIEVINALNNNEVVAMLVDRSVKDGLEVPFFGRTIKFPSGPLRLAGATGAPIVPAFVVKEKDGYRAVAEKLIFFDKEAGDTPENAARSVVEVFERYIRRYPDQWFNFVPIG
ncbi:MAG: lysophospholipid acyltransferase family protein [Thermodesulfobacteriota bacterium]